jgi:hypothetical protein
LLAIGCRKTAWAAKSTPASDIRYARRPWCRGSQRTANEVQLAQMQIAMRTHAKMLIAAQSQGPVGYFKLGADLNDGRWPVWEIPEKILEPAHDVGLASTRGNDVVDRRHPHALE